MCVRTSVLFLFTPSALEGEKEASPVPRGKAVLCTTAHTKGAARSEEKLKGGLGLQVSRGGRSPGKKLLVRQDDVLLSRRTSVPQGCFALLTETMAKEKAGKGRG